MNTIKIVIAVSILTTAFAAKGLAQGESGLQLPKQCTVGGSMGQMGRGGGLGGFH